MAALAEASGGPVGGDTDALPGGTGPFGRSAANPVPVAGFGSSTYYLERLRTPDGYPVQYHRLGSGSSPVSDKPVDRYQLTNWDSEAAGEVFISPYHQRTSDRAPEGLRLLGE